jgi:putative endopeptidase
MKNAKQIKSKSLQAVKYKSIGFSVKNMDLSKDPFEDFYIYSCGTWIKRHKLPKDKPRINSFSELEDKNTMLLRHIINSCVLNPSKYGKHGKLLADFYLSFMDTKTLDKLKLKPIKSIMNEIESLQHKEDLQMLMVHLLRSNVSPFFVLYTTEDNANSNIYSLYIDQGGLGMPDKDYYTKDTFLGIKEKYLEYMKKIFMLYGTQEHIAKANAVAAFEIENELAKASRTPAELRDTIKNYNKMSMHDVEQRYKHIGFGGILYGLGANATYIVIGQPEFFDSLDKLIDEKSIESLKSYLRWKVLNSAASKLHKKMRNEHFNFYGKVLEGMKREEPRWKKAIEEISDSIGEALGELYVRENFSSAARKKAEVLVENVKGAFRERLKVLRWMGSVTKARALRKFDVIGTKLGHPAKFKNYTKIKTSKDDLFGNIIRAANFELDRQISRIGKKVDRSEWNMNVFEADAYYDPSKNEIVLPAGIFNAPFFDPNADDAINYGAIGAIIGHELTHGYDDQGSLFDEKGNVKNWWTSHDRKRFNMHARKIANLYNSLEVLPGIKDNGKLTLGESIADLGGFRIAYDALRLSMKNSSKGIGLINGFTQEQRFFIAFSQMWKGSSTKNEEKLAVSIDPHPIERLRGLIPPLTHPEFKELFKDKSKLSEPKEKFPDIEIW